MAFPTVQSFPGAASAPAYNPYDDVAGAKVFNSTPFFPVGDYVVEVDTLKNIPEVTNGRATGNVRFIPECIRVDGPDAGQKYCAVWTIGPKDAQYGYGKSDIKRFVIALFRAMAAQEGSAIPSEEDLIAQGALSGANIQAITGTDVGPDGKPSGSQPCRGVRLRVIVTEKPTKNGPTAQNKRGVVSQYQWFTPTA